jgi:hypothetical protein
MELVGPNSEVRMADILLLLVWGVSGLALHTEHIPSSAVIT